MHWILSISFLLILAGVGLLIDASRWPVYTDPTAPDRIGNALSPDGDEDAFDQWFSQLRAYETPYKTLSDLGRGLAAAGIGCLLALWWWRGYQRRPRLRTKKAVLAVWILLWSSLIPFSVWFYMNRMLRHDYPWWGDSIMIGIFGNTISAVVGAIVTSPVLLLLFKQHPLSGDIVLEKPRSIGGWARATLLISWIGFLGLNVESGIRDGDEGAVIPCLVAAVILAAFLTAKKVPAFCGVGGSRQSLNAVVPLTRTLSILLRWNIHGAG